MASITIEAKALYFLGNIRLTAKVTLTRVMKTANEIFQRAARMAMNWVNDILAPGQNKLSRT